MEDAKSVLLLAQLHENNEQVLPNALDRDAEYTTLVLLRNSYDSVVQVKGLLLPVSSKVS